MRAFFSPASNKLISCELCFDTGLIVSQLRKQQYPVTYPIHDDFAANIFGETGSFSDADRLLHSLEMLMLPDQSCTQSSAPTQSLNRGILRESIISAEHEHDWSATEWISGKFCKLERVSENHQKHYAGGFP